MRILMLTDFFAPFVGGVEQHVRVLSHQLARRGHQVAVATQRASGLPEFEVDAGVRIYRISGAWQRTARLSSDPQRRWSPPAPDPELTWALRSLIARERPEIVHAHTWMVHSFVPLKAWSGAKLVVSLHNYGFHCLRTDLLHHGKAVCDGPAFGKCLGCCADHFGAARGVPAVVAFWLTSPIVRSATDMFLPVSRAVAEGSGLVGSGLPFRIIPNFLPDDLASGGTTEGLDAHLAELPDEDFLLFVGALRPMKGVAVLLDAYAGLPDAPPLVLIGGTFHDTPRQFPPNVTVLRDWPHEAVMAAWRRSLLGLIPSIWPEPFGIVAIEAMAMGVPLIASQIGGLANIVADGETGLLVRPGDADELRGAIGRVLRDPSLRQRMGAAARRKAGDFRAGAIVPQIEEVYRSAARTTLLGGLAKGLAPQRTRRRAGSLSAGNRK